MGQESSDKISAKTGSEGELLSYEGLGWFLKDRQYLYNDSVSSLNASAGRFEKPFTDGDL
jgi:hypothetical protein